jgi:hypothetical protein
VGHCCYSRRWLLSKIRKKKELTKDLVTKEKKQKHKNKRHE